MSVKVIFIAIALGAGLGIATSGAVAQSQYAKLDQRAQNTFEAAMDGICETMEPGSVLGPAVPEIYQLSYNFGDEDVPPRPFRLYEFPCTAGAYNFGYVYFAAKGFGEVRQIQFASPVFDVTRQNDDFQSAVTGIEVIGFTADDILINSGFNMKTKTIFSFYKWRGLGDASSAGQWFFREGQFVLQTYDVDATYDDQVNPIRIYGGG